MAFSRIVSLVPAATEALFALGAGGAVRAATHRCTRPAEAALLPRAITSPVDPGSMTGPEIDAANSRLAREAGTSFVLDEEAVRLARPDLIVSQEVCRSCAPHGEHAARAAAALGYEPAVHAYGPRTLGGILSAIGGLAALVGREERGAALVAGLRARLGRARAARPARRPSVFVAEWAGPLYTAGHWVPDIVEAAGGRSVLAEPGGRSRRIPASEVAAADPDFVLVAPCGLGAERAAREYREGLALMQGWGGLRAVREGRAYAIDADSYTSRPGPSAVAGVELVAALLSGRAGDAPPGSWAPLGGA